MNLPAEGHNTTRRAALGALASVPALVILPAMAVASPASSARLADLIAAHQAAMAALPIADKVVDELTDPGHPHFFSRPPAIPERRRHAREHVTQNMEVMFEFETTKLTESMSRWLSPEIGDAARGMLETKRAECLSQIEASYGDYEAAQSVIKEAEKASDKALEAVCAHRCASIDELTIKARYLANNAGGLEPEQCVAFYRSLLPEGEEIDEV